MAQPDPYAAFLTALQDAYAAGGGRPNAFTPGVQGIPTAGAPADPTGAPSVIGGVAGGGGSVPGTATTGQSIVGDIIGGGVSADPIAQDLVSRTFNIGRDESTADLGAGVTGGELGALASILGGPLGAASIIGSLVMSDALGLPPSPSVSLAEIAGTEDFGQTRSPTLASGQLPPLPPPKPERVESETRREERQRGAAGMGGDQSFGLSSDNFAL